MNCCRCGNRHVGLLIYADPRFRFLFAQEIEQWCDMNLSDSELRSMRAIPLHKVKSSSLHSFLAMANTIVL